MRCDSLRELTSTSLKMLRSQRSIYCSRFSISMRELTTPVSILKLSRSTNGRKWVLQLGAQAADAMDAGGLLAAILKAVRLTSTRRGVRGPWSRYWPDQAAPFRRSSPPPVLGGQPQPGSAGCSGQVRRYASYSPLPPLEEFGLGKQHVLLLGAQGRDMRHQVLPPFAQHMRSGTAEAPAAAAPCPRSRLACCGRSVQDFHQWTG